jgi:hypothetical protein
LFSGVSVFGAQVRQRRLVNRKHGEEGDAFEPSLPELFDEVDTHAARHEHEDRIGLGGRDLGELGGEVELPQRGVDLVGDRALEVLLEAADHILARLIVGRQQEGFAEAFVLRVFAEHLRGLIVLV